MNMYFVAVVLPEVINEKVLRYKNIMLEKYGCRVGLKSPAHITLLPPFWMDETKEAELLRELEKLQYNRPFTLSTDHFSSFRPRTIFIALKESAELIRLKETTDHLFKDHPEFKIKIDSRPFHPHITIATRDLHKKSFHEAWPLFSDKTFSESWLVEGISLLKHNTRNWDVMHTIPFQNPAPA